LSETGIVYTFSPAHENIPVLKQGMLDVLFASPMGSGYFGEVSNA